MDPIDFLETKILFPGGGGGGLHVWHMSHFLPDMGVNYIHCNQLQL
jgi:hypothetical protein